MNGADILSLALAAASAKGEELQPVAMPLDVATARCSGLQIASSGAWGRIESVAIRPAEVDLPLHCEVFGRLQDRKGIGGRHFAIRYHLRMPVAWNGRFLFQGGSGTNGVVGDATGPLGRGVASALSRGFAVISQDSGHDNARNSDPAAGGAAAFGLDPLARTNYGHASLPLVARTGKALVHAFYKSAPRFSYFFGCSKGGQEGMAFAQRYPQYFDGIVAAAPGMSLPRAALNQAWSVQQFAALAVRQTGKPASIANMAGSFTAADWSLIRQSALAACDGLDGVRDGISANWRQCTRSLVLSKLSKVTCVGGDRQGCIDAAKVETLDRVLSGPPGRRGRSVYSDFPWDPGIGSPDWTFWKVGANGAAGLDVGIGGPAISALFSVPPEPHADTDEANLAFLLGLHFPGAEARIYRKEGRFETSAWRDIGMRSPDLQQFLARRGKLLVPHGVADPVFSINDSIRWYDALKARYGGSVSDSVRVFPVPGMAHCGGGPSTDSYDAMAALITWVEKGIAPDSIIARSGHGRLPGVSSRPLCAYPKVATYVGGPSAEAISFSCKFPSDHGI